jgi:DNA-binding Lrp family transcriptional regulator
MRDQQRDEGGRFAGKVTEQDILKIFDRTGEPVTAPEIAEELPITSDAVTYRLKNMKEKGLVERKKTGANSVVWWAKVAWGVDSEFAESVEEADTENAVPHEELDEELNRRDESEDAFFAAPTFTTDEDDVSERVDEYLNEAGS